jgi:hypothetical protein
MPCLLLAAAVVLARAVGCMRVMQARIGGRRRRLVHRGLRLRLRLLHSHPHPADETNLAFSSSLL